MHWLWVWQVLALDLVTGDTTLIDKVQCKLLDKNKVTPSSVSETYQLNVITAISLYPSYIWQHNTVLLTDSDEIIIITTGIIIIYWH